MQRFSTQYCYHRPAIGLLACDQREQICANRRLGRYTMELLPIKPLDGLAAPLPTPLERLRLTPALSGAAGSCTSTPSWPPSERRRVAM